MTFVMLPIARLEAWFSRRTAWLDAPRAPLMVAIIAPLVFGLLSVMLGQDDNWDLKNYHLYNAYALLNERLPVDMAPGNWQSYFNPTLDVPYYLLVSWLPGPVVGFIFGLLHGLNFVLVLGIARTVLNGAEGSQRFRVPVLLAVAGVCGAGFLSELGNTMGDNMTALFVLGAVYLLLKHWDRLPRKDGMTVLAVLFCGFLMGMGTGLKLTNATYALALCASVCVVPAPWGQRARLAYLLGVGVLAGIGLTAGYWFLEMFQNFANPVFPQFNNIFRSPLALQIGVIDHFHMPKNVLEGLFWPVVFTFDILRVSEVGLKQTIWPVLYLLFVGVCGYLLYVRFGGKDGKPAFSPRAKFLLVFTAIAYLAWMKLFGIYRYLVPLELIAPLLVWILLHRVLQAAPARRVAGWTLVVTTLSVFPFVTWGHAGWASKSFSADVPAMAQPESSIVFTAHGHPPMGWLATFMPKGVSVISLGSGFPESPAYVARINKVMDQRPGPYYVMLFASKNYKETSLRRKLELAQWLGLTQSAQGCARLDSVLQRVRFQAEVKPVSATECTLELPPKYRMDLPELDRGIVAAAAENLARYGLQLNASSCKIYPAAIGADPYPYQLCGVTRPAR